MTIFLVGFPRFPFLAPLKSVHGYPVVPICTLSTDTLRCKREGLNQAVNYRYEIDVYRLK